MKKKFDFVLNDSGYYRDIFRYYPRSTHVHSFNENPPKTWNEVYKVYYSWAVIRQYYDDNGKVEGTNILFNMPCDECSIIPNLSGIIRHVVTTGEIYDYPTFGQPAGDWCIEQRKGRRDCDNENYEYYKFQVFDNWSNQGFRFTLDKEETIQFCDWLDMINQYALEHGEEI